MIPHGPAVFLLYMAASMVPLFLLMLLAWSKEPSPRWERVGFISSVMLIFNGCVITGSVLAYGLPYLVERWAS